MIEAGKGDIDQAQETIKTNKNLINPPHTRLETFRMAGEKISYCGAWFEDPFIGLTIEEETAIMAEYGAIYER